jgi:hypothetical protein
LQCRHGFYALFGSQPGGAPEKTYPAKRKNGQTDITGPLFGSINKILPGYHWCD